MASVGEHSASAGIARRLGVAGACGLAALLALVCWLIVDTVMCVVRVYHPLPTNDEWDFVVDLRRWFAASYGLDDLCRQHNEHRIAVPRLLLFADYLGFAGQGVFLAGVILGIQLAHAAVLTRLARQPSAPPRWRLLGAGVVLAAMFSTIQIENFASGFQVQFVLVYLAGSVAMVALARSAPPAGSGATRAGWLAGSIAAGVVANWSMANGLLVWPLMLSLAWQLRVSRRALAALTVAGAASIAAWFTGYHVARHHPPPWEVPGALLHVLTFVAAYVGAPLAMHGLWPCVVLGALGLLGCCWLFLLSWRRGRLACEEHALVHVMVFVAGTALMTALGRLHYDVSYALTSRYATPSFLFWASQLLVLMSLAQRATVAARRWRWLVAVASVLFIAVLACAQRQAVGWVEERPLARERAALSLITRVRDDAAMRWVYPDQPQEVAPRAEVLREHGLSVFPGERIGEPLARRFAVVTADACRGKLECALTLPRAHGAKKVRGWAMRADGSAVDRVLLVDSAGVICGLAGGGWWRPDLDSKRRDLHVGFEGYVTNPIRRDDQLRAYALLADGSSVCQLDGHVDRAIVNAGAVPWESASDIGARVGIPLQAFGEDAWTPNGKYPSESEPPFPCDIMGSWSGSDANTGRLALGPFVRDGHTAVVLPLLVGPSGEGQSLRLVDVQHGITLARLVDPRRLGHAWMLWQVDIPPGLDGRPLALVAEDSGKGFGQWMAVGMPFWLE